MSAKLYKARWHFRDSDILETSKHDSFALRVEQWLRDNDRLDHYVTSYIKGHDGSDTAEYVVVLRDANTAVMLKLALIQ